jgi:putative transposase
MRLMDEIYLKDPTLGTRRLVTVLERDCGLAVNRKRLQRLRRFMGVEAIYCRPRTSIPHRGHKVYPYLLRDMTVTKPNKVWCTDITYVPMKRGHGYLCAVMDWHSRKVLGWSVSNTMDTHLCLEALRKAVKAAGCVPEILNSDQGSQFTSEAWTGELQRLGIQVSMDGKGRWMDNVFIERLWRSVKYEDIYLRGYTDLACLERGLGAWIERYNRWRPHQALGNKTPWEVHGEGLAKVHAQRERAAA